MEDLKHPKLNECSQNVKQNSHDIKTFNEDPNHVKLENSDSVDSFQHIITTITNTNTSTNTTSTNTFNTNNTTTQSESNLYGPPFVYPYPCVWYPPPATPPGEQTRPYSWPYAYAATPCRPMSPNITETNAHYASPPPPPPMPPFAYYYPYPYPHPPQAYPVPPTCTKTCETEASKNFYPYPPPPAPYYSYPYPVPPTYTPNSSRASSVLPDIIITPSTDDSPPKEIHKIKIKKEKRLNKGSVEIEEVECDFQQQFRMNGVKTNVLETDSEQSTDDSEETPKFSQANVLSKKNLQSVKSVTNVQVYNKEENGSLEDDSDSDVTTMDGDSEVFDSDEELVEETEEIEEIEETEIQPEEFEVDDLTTIYEDSEFERSNCPTPKLDVEETVKLETNSEKDIKEPEVKQTEEYDVIAALRATKLQTQKIKEQSESYWGKSFKENSSENKESEVSESSSKEPDKKDEESFTNETDNKETDAEKRMSIEEARNNFWSTFNALDEPVTKTTESENTDIDFWKEIQSCKQHGDWDLKKTASKSIDYVVEHIKIIPFYNKMYFASAEHLPKSQKPEISLNTYSNLKHCDWDLNKTAKKSIDYIEQKIKMVPFYNKMHFASAEELPTPQKPDISNLKHCDWQLKQTASKSTDYVEQKIKMVPFYNKMHFASAEELPTPQTPEISLSPYSNYNNLYKFQDDSEHEKFSGTEDRYNYEYEDTYEEEDENEPECAYIDEEQEYVENYEPAKNYIAYDRSLDLDMKPNEPTSVTNFQEQIWTEGTETPVYKSLNMDEYEPERNIVHEESEEEETDTEEPDEEEQEECAETDLQDTQEKYMSQDVISEQPTEPEEEIDFWAEIQKSKEKTENFDPTKYPEEPREVDTEEEYDFWAEIEANRSSDEINFQKTAQFWEKRVQAEDNAFLFPEQKPAPNLVSFPSEQLIQFKGEDPVYMNLDEELPQIDKAEQDDSDDDDSTAENSEDESTEEEEQKEAYTGNSDNKQDLDRATPIVMNKKNIFEKTDEEDLGFKRFNYRKAMPAFSHPVEEQKEQIPTNKPEETQETLNYSKDPSVDIERNKSSEDIKISVQQRISAFESGNVIKSPTKPDKTLLGATLSVESKTPTKNLSRDNSQRSESEVDEDSGVTDMNRPMSETDTESDGFPELRKMSSYQRANTHSRLFKLLQEDETAENMQAAEEELQTRPSRRKIVHNVSVTRRQNPEAVNAAESMAERRERLSLPLYNNISIDADNPSTPNSPASPILGQSANSRVISEKLVKELVQSLLLRSDSTHFKDLPMAKLQAAAKRALEEELDSVENSSVETTPARTPNTGKSEPAYNDYYATWSDASAHTDIVPSKTFRTLQEKSSGRKSPWSARCPRVLSSKTVNTDLARVRESPEFFSRCSQSPVCFAKEGSITKWRKP